MDKAASIFLRTEIEPDDLRYLAHWLRNNQVTRYLNEAPGISDALEQLLRSTPVPLLTLRLNQYGRFFMICRRRGAPIGFVRLSERGAGSFEIVFAVGDQSLWGKGYGSQAVRAALRQAFLEGRARKLTAKIYHENRRSISIIRSCGFTRESQTENLGCFAITMDQYLDFLRAEARENAASALLEKSLA